MNIDLSNYVNKEVEVVFEDGTTAKGKITTFCNATYSYELNHLDSSERKWKWGVYTKDGYFWEARIPCFKNIKSIRTINMTNNYQELEQKAKEMQNALDEMNKEIARLKKEEDKKTKLPSDFSRKDALSFLDNPNRDSLNDAFTWRCTPQGDSYWCGIYDNLDFSSVMYKVPDEAIRQIQEWVIESYRQEFGD